MTLRSSDLEGHGSLRIFCCCNSAWVALAVCAGAPSYIRIIPRPLAGRWGVATGSKMSCWYLAALKSLLHQGLSEPEFYGDLVNKFKKIRGMTDFSDQFRKIIMRYKRIGYNLNVLRQSACLVIYPITVDGYAALFNCTPVDRATDSMMAPT